MAVILDVMPEGTYRRMMTPALEAELAALGTIISCRNAGELTEAEYGALWEQADAVLSGWGVRPPTPDILDRAVKLKVISHTAGSVRMFPRYALEKGVIVTSARADGPLLCRHRRYRPRAAAAQPSPPLAAQCALYPAHRRTHRRRSSLYDPHGDKRPCACSAR